MILDHASLVRSASEDVRHVERIHTTARRKNPLARVGVDVTPVEVLPELWRDDVGIGDSTSRVFSADGSFHEELLGDHLVLPVPSVDVVAVLRRFLACIADGLVACVGADLRAEPRWARVPLVRGRGDRG